MNNLVPAPWLWTAPDRKKRRNYSGKCDASRQCCAVHRRVFDSDVTGTYLILPVPRRNEQSLCVKTNHADRAIMTRNHRVPHFPLTTRRTCRLIYPAIGRFRASLVRARICKFGRGGRNYTLFVVSDTRKLGLLIKTFTQSLITSAYCELNSVSDDVD